MKYLYPALFFLCFNFSCKGQTTTDLMSTEHEINENHIYEEKEVDEKAVFYNNGRPSEVYEFIKPHIKFPEKYIKQKLKGRLLIRFVVEKDGTISDIKTVESINKDIDKMYSKALKTTSGMWKPAVKDSVNVRSYYSYPVGFLGEIKPYEKPSFRK